MDEDYCVPKYWSELETDFIDKKTNIYAKINVEDNMCPYYIKVNQISQEEISMRDDIYSFYFCRITKVKDNVYKETKISKKYLVSEKTILASEFVESNLTNNKDFGIFEYKLKKRGDYYICYYSYEDEYGNPRVILKPKGKREEIVNRPKSLRLEN